MRRSFLRAVASAAGQEGAFFPPDTNPVYNRRSFNEYGDVVSHLGRKGMNPDSIFVKPLPPMKDFNKGTLSDLNGIADEAKVQNARAYFLFPSYIASSYDINVAPIDSLRQKLAGGMRMPILGTPRDFVYPGSYFFDTRFHLNEQGRRIRTLKMIDLLRSIGVNRQ